MSFNNRNDDSEPPMWRNQHDSFNLNSKILFLTIVTFSIIILIVLANHLYIRFILRRYTSSFFQDHPVDVSSQPPNRGLDTLIIASLPTFVVEVNGDLTATECPVCLSLFKENDTARMLPNCKHVFHVACVDTWLNTCSTCPVCRTEVEPSQKLEPEPREGPVGDFAATYGTDDKTGGSSVLRLDLFSRTMPRERSSNTNDHSHVDQDRASDLERQ